MIAFEISLVSLASCCLCTIRLIDIYLFMSLSVCRFLFFDSGNFWSIRSDYCLSCNLFIALAENPTGCIFEPTQFTLLVS